MQDTIERVAAGRQFLDLELGMFVHFGLYSQGRDHEWHMWIRGMNLPRYKHAFLRSFDPDPAGIEQWMDVAARMGARYVVVTSKHCDGFCLWDTTVPHGIDLSYHIRNTSFFEKHGRDVLDVLFEAAATRGIRVGLYHAVIDWSWLRPRFGYRRHYLKNDGANDRYCRNLHARLVELVERYPDLLLLWLDGYQMVPDGLRRLGFEKTSADIKQINPGVLLGVNSGTTNASRSLLAGDFLIYENMAHHGEANPVPWPRNDPLDRPAEGCLTLNDHWGYNEHDKKFKDPALIARLVRENAARRANTLVNVGPGPDGFVPGDQDRVAGAIGEALSRR